MIFLQNTSRRNASSMEIGRVPQMLLTQSGCFGGRGFGSAYNKQSTDSLIHIHLKSSRGLELHHRAKKRGLDPFSPNQSNSKIQTMYSMWGFSEVLSPEEIWGCGTINMEAHLNLHNQLTYHNCTRPYPLEGSIHGIA